MSQENPIFTAPRLSPKLSLRAPESPPRSSARSSVSTHDYGTFYRDLSPTKTLHAIDANVEGATADSIGNADQLLKALAGASDVDKAFARKVAKTSKSLKEWCSELESWSWNDGFSTAISSMSRDPDSSIADGLARENRGRSAGGNSNPSDTLHATDKSPRQITPSNAPTYEDRIQLIKDALDTLGIEEQKSYVLKYHVPEQARSSNSDTSQPATPTKDFNRLDDLTALVTAILMQALPYYSKLMSLLTIWSVRLSVLKQIPPFMLALRVAADNLLTSSDIIQGTQTDVEDTMTLSSSKGNDSEAIKETVRDMRGKLEVDITEVGRRLDSMLDVLEGHDESLPNELIDTVDDLEFKYSNWTIEAEQFVARIDQNSKQADPAEDAPPSPDRFEGPAWVPDLDDSLRKRDGRHFDFEELHEPFEPDLDSALQGSVAESSFYAEAHEELPATLSSIPQIIDQLKDADSDQDFDGFSDVYENKISMDSYLTRDTPDASRKTSEDTLHTPEQPKPNSFPPFNFVDTTKFSDEFEVGSKEIGQHQNVGTGVVSENSLLQNTVKESENRTDINNGSQKTPRTGPLSSATLSPPSPSWNNESFLSASDEESMRLGHSGDDGETSSIRASYKSASVTLIESYSRAQVKRVEVGRSISFPSTPLGNNRGHQRQESKASQRSISTDAYDRIPLRSPDWHTQTFQTLDSVPMLSLKQPSPVSKDFRMSHLIDSFSSPIHGERSLELSEDYSRAQEKGDALDKLKRLLQTSSPVQDEPTADQDIREHSYLPETGSDTPVEDELTSFRTDPTLSPSPPASDTTEGSTPATHLEKQIDRILTKVPMKIQLQKRRKSKATAIEPVTTAGEISSTRTRAPTSTKNGPSLTLVPVRLHDEAKRSSTDTGIRLYHLTQPGKRPVKLYVRVVGEAGERVMVRVGGGWADFEEYLRDYVSHHRAEKMTLSGASRLRNVTTPAAPKTRTPRTRRSEESATLRSDSPALESSPSPVPSSTSRSQTPTVPNSVAPASNGEEVESGGLAGPRRYRELTAEKQAWLDGMVANAKKWKAEKDEREREQSSAGLADMGKVGNTRRLYRTSGSHG